MKHFIRIVTHMIFSGAFILLFANAFHSVWDLIGYGLLTMILNIFLYGIRNKAKTFRVFLGNHIALLGGGGYLIVLVGTYKWYAAIWCVWIIYSAILRLAPIAEELDEPRKMYIVLLVVEYFVIGFLDGPRFARSIVIVSTLLVLILYLLYENLESMDRFISVGSFSNQVDEQGIRKLNRRLSLLYVGIIGAILAIFSLFRVEGLWITIKRWMFKLLRFLVSLIPMAEKAQPEEEMQIEEAMPNFLQEMVPEKEVSAIGRLIGEIIYGIIMIAIVAVIIVAIISAVIYVYRHFYNKKNREEEDRVIEALSLGDEVKKEKKSRFFEKFDRSPAKRIRRIYRKRLKKIVVKHQSSLKYMSPAEQMEFLRKQDVSEEVIGAIQSLYEKARYSAELVTEADAERMREILR